MPKEVVTRLDAALGNLLERVDYVNDELDVSFNGRINIRRGCAAVAVSMLKQGHDIQSVKNTLSSAQEDMFAEVRLEAE
jgi:hypothetical protein